MKIGHLFGVTLRVNLLFLALAAIATYYGYGLGVCVTVASVLAHEIAHGLVSAAYGLPAREIELMPFGGISKLKGLLELHPEAEARVAIAGPINSMIIAGILYLFMRSGMVSGDWASTALVANSVLGLFNFLPLLPLDGGRIIRSYLAKRLGYVTGTRKMAGFSIVISIILSLSGVGLYVLGYPDGISASVAMAFVALGGIKEYKSAGIAMMRYLLSRKELLMKLGFMQVEGHVVLEGISARRLVKAISPRKYHIYHVTRDGSEIGRMVTEHQLIEGYLDGGPDLTIGEIYRGCRGNGPPNVEM